MRVLCIGDSLGLPREGVNYDGTWISKLKKARPGDDFIGLFVRQLTSIDLVDVSSGKARGDFSYYYMPDVVVLQVGICDCAPRYYNSKKNIWKLIEKIGVRIVPERIYWRIIKFLFKRRASAAYVPLNQFSMNIKIFIEYLINKLHVANIIIIKIGKPDKNVLAKSPDMFSQIEKYNNVYTELGDKYCDKVSVIDPLSEGDERLYVDGYHTNERGGQVVFESLIEEFILRGL